MRVYLAWFLAILVLITPLGLASVSATAPQENRLNQAFLQSTPTPLPNLECPPSEDNQDATSGRREVEELYPESWQEEFAELNENGETITWNQELMGYQRTSDCAVFYPGVGMEKTGNSYDEDDFRDGWLFVTESVQTQDFVLGESGVKISFGISIAHPLYSAFEFDDRITEQGRQVFSEGILEMFPSVKGRHLIVQIISDDTTHAASPSRFQVLDRNGVEAYVRDECATGEKEIDDTNVIFLRISVFRNIQDIPEEEKPLYFASDVYSCTVFSIEKYITDGELPNQAFWSHTGDPDGLFQQLPYKMFDASGQEPLFNPWLVIPK